MKYQKTIFFIIIILVMTAIVTIVINNNHQNKDAIQFKEEYESLNNTIRESDGAKYNNVNIPSDNPIKYITAKEAVNVINNENAVIYFGANWCPWCRNAIPVLFASALSQNIDTIYYVNMAEIRNVWEIQDRKLVKTREEQEGYYDLLNSLDSVLSPSTYTLKDEDGTTYDTNEKRIYMPLVIVVKNGKIIDNHVGTVNLNDGQTKYDDLTKSQHQELLTIYNNMLSKINTSMCQNNEMCS